MKKTRILVIPSDTVGGVGFYRSIKPHIALEQKYPDEFHIDILPTPDFSDLEFFKQYDIVHYHKYLGDYEDTAKNVEALEALGVTTIMDIDDHWLPDMRHPMHRQIVQGKYDKKVIDNLRSAKAITTTTDLFANEIKKLNKNVYVIENGIDKKEPQFTPKPTKSEKVRIGWLGGSTHLEDLRPLQDNINKLMASPLKDKVQFVVCGFDLRGSVRDFDHNTKQYFVRPMRPMETSWYEYEKIFTNNYTTISPEYKAHLLKFTQEEFPGVENEPYRRVWTKPIANYATSYNEFDIALAPLATSTFNQCKSQLKVIEAGFFRKPIIAQDFGAYQLDIKNAFNKGGVYDETANGLLVKSVNNKSDWFKFMKKLVEDADLRESLGNNLHNDIVAKFDLDVLSEKRRDFYYKIILEQKKSFAAKYLVK